MSRTSFRKSLPSVKHSRNFVCKLNTFFTSSVSRVRFRGHQVINSRPYLHCISKQQFLDSKRNSRADNYLQVLTPLLPSSLLELTAMAGPRPRCRTTPRLVREVVWSSLELYWDLELGVSWIEFESEHIRRYFIYRYESSDYGGLARFQK